MQAATLLPAGQRIIPIQINGLTDNSEEDIVHTSGYGDRKRGRFGDYIWVGTYWDGAMCLNKQIQMLKGMNVKLMLVDNENKLFGHFVDGDLYGYSGGILPIKLKIADGTNTAVYSFEINLTDPQELNSEFGCIPFTFNFGTQIKGLVGVSLEVIGSTETYVDVKATMSCGCTDLYDNFDDELADVAVWKILNSSGVAVTISGAAKQVATKAWRLEATLTAGTYTVSGSTPVLWAAEGVGAAPANGMETDVVSFTTSS